MIDREQDAAARRPRGFAHGGWWLALTPVLLVACSDTPEASDPRRAAVRDSAGIVLVDHGVVDLNGLPLWIPGETPMVSIGAVEGDALEGDPSHQLHRVGDVRRRSDGSIVVLDQGNQVRAFDAAGTHLWTAGGEGQGPGEFQFASMIREVRGDSLLVWDGLAKRLSILTSGGAFVRSATVRGPEAPYIVAWGMSGTDHVLVEARHGERTRIDGHEALVHPSEFQLVDLDGEVHRALGRRILATQFQEVDENGAFSPAIFDVPAVVGAAPGGLWFGDAREYELRLEDGPDQVRRIVRWQGPDRTVSAADVQAALEVWGQGPNAGPELHRFLAEYGRTHPRADRFAAYEDLLVDRSGRLWVRDFVKDHRDDGLRDWTVFSGDGTEMIARFRHRAAFEPYDVGDGWLLGVERDDLGIEQVRLYGIVHER